MYIEHSLLLTHLWEGTILLHYESYGVYTIIGYASPILNPV